MILGVSKSRVQWHTWMRLSTKPGMVPHTSNPRTQEGRQEDEGFEVTLHYAVS